MIDPKVSEWTAKEICKSVYNGTHQVTAENASETAAALYAWGKGSSQTARDNMDRVLSLCKRFGAGPS